MSIQHGCVFFTSERRRRQQVDTALPRADPAIIPDVGYHPVLSGDLTVVSHPRGIIAAYGEGDAPHWEYRLKKPYIVSMAYNGEIAGSGSDLLVNDSDHLTVLDLRSGALKTRNPVPEMNLVQGAPVDAGLITATRREGKSQIARYSGPSCKDPVWTSPTSAASRWISASENLCCFSRTKQVIAAVDPASGAERWSFALAEFGAYEDPSGSRMRGEAATPPILWQDRVILGVSGRRIVGLDSASGAIAWQAQVDAITPSSIALAPDGILHVIDHPRYLRLDASTGEMRAVMDLAEQFRDLEITMVNSIDMSTTHVFTSGAYGTVIAIRQADGAIDWTYRVPGQAQFINYPIATDRGLWFLDAANRLLRFPV